MRAKGFILQPTYRIESRKPVLQLYGRLETGAAFLVRDTRRTPHFFVKERDAAAARALGAKPCAPTGKTNFAGESVARVDVAVPGDVPSLRDRLQAARIVCYEADVRFALRPLMEMGIRGSLEIDGEPRDLSGQAATPQADPDAAAITGHRGGNESSAAGGRGPTAMARSEVARQRAPLLVFENPSLAPADWTPKLSVLSFDIETDPTARRLLSISLYGCGASEVLLLTPPGRTCPPPAIPFTTEGDLLRAFCARVRQLDPDVLTGWNVIDFDLLVLLRIAERCRIPLEMGRAPGPVRIQSARTMWGTSQAFVPGRTVLEGINLLRGAFIRMDDYSLDAVSRDVLGEGKTMHGHDRAAEILRAFHEDRPRFVEYNLTDSRLVLQILEKLRLVELAVERSRLTGMPPDRVAASIASFDFLYLSQLARCGVVAPTVRAAAPPLPLEGAAVSAPPGSFLGGSLASVSGSLSESQLDLDPDSEPPRSLFGGSIASVSGAPSDSQLDLDADSDAAAEPATRLGVDDRTPVEVGRTFFHVGVREQDSRPESPDVAGTASESDAFEPTLGGHVLEPVPGLYRNVLVFDFKSLYPSIIRTFQIDPLGYIPSGSSSADLTGADPTGADASGVDASEVDPIVAPNGAAFRRTPGILPGLLDDLFPRREQARRSGDEVKAHAIKILMNSFYGVLGTSACRFHNPDIANAITGFGRELLLWSKDRIEQSGARVLYGDTDSLFVQPGMDDPEQARNLAQRLAREINEDLTEHIRGRWRVESRLDLRFDSLYLRLLLPHLRHGTAGARKRYAGLVARDSGPPALVFTGLEVVRRDWTELAKQVQREMYERLFADQPVEEYLRGVVADLREGRLDGLLVYRKALRKGLEDYTKNTPPHVAAARKMSVPPGRLVSYIITTAGPEPAGESRHEIDHEHYVQKQVRPVAEPILDLLALSFDRVVGDETQMSLF